MTEQHNDEFLNMVEAYFSQPTEVKLADARPQYSYQVGVTPEFQEVPRCTFDEECQRRIQSYTPGNEAHMPRGADAKWRYFWRIGERPVGTEFGELNAEPVIPNAFPQWSQVMNQWGGLMRQSVGTVAEMAAIGFGLPADAFTSRAENGPHLLAPTASDLQTHGKLETIFAGFHYDLNFLTIHGKSRFPGLLIWTREGKRVRVRVPDGCLLVQAGKQFEYLTGGHVQAGFHEVIVLPETLQAVEKARAAGRPLWRISSTLFYHIASDQVLEPLLPMEADDQSQAAYPPIKAGLQVQQELMSINLKK